MYHIWYFLIFSCTVSLRISAPSCRWRGNLVNIWLVWIILLELCGFWRALQNKVSKLDSKTQRLKSMLIQRKAGIRRVLNGKLPEVVMVIRLPQFFFRLRSVPTFGRMFYERQYAKDWAEDRRVQFYNLTSSTIFLSGAVSQSYLTSNLCYPLVDAKYNQHDESSICFQRWKSETFMTFTRESSTSRQVVILFARKVLRPLHQL